jgi:ubiquitin-like-specific protease 1C/D
MSASSGGIVIDRRQAMPPDSPAVELEVVGSPSPSVAPCPAAAAGADADIDHGGGAAEFEQVSDKKLQERISRCEGMLKQGIPQRTPDGGEKMQACVLRMKKELERRRARQWKVRKMWTLRNKFPGSLQCFSPFLFWVRLISGLLAVGLVIGLHESSVRLS